VVKVFSNIKHAFYAGISLGLLGLTIAAPGYASDSSEGAASMTAANSATAAIADANLEQSPSSAVTQPNAPTQPDSPVTLSDIVVTAQRRSERLHDVPLAITAITPEIATATGLRNMVDIKLLTPSVDFTSSTGFAMLFIRGIGRQFPTPGLEPPVAVYLDNAYVPRVGGLNALVDLVDPGTIEIIRGPQGTLYGRNATGGVIRISSADPTNQLEGRLMAEYGRFKHEQVDGMLNVPVNDDLSIRFAGRFQKEDGYVTNSDGQTLPEVNNYTARARVKWTPSNSVQVVGGVEWQHSKANGFNDQLGLGAPTCYVCRSTGEKPGGFYDSSVTIIAPYVNRAFRSDLRVNVELNDFTFTSTTTYFDNNSIQDAENNFTRAPVFLYNVHILGGNTFGQELQVSYKGSGPLSFIAAANYLNDRSVIDISLDGLAYQFAVNAAGAFPENRVDLDTKSYSGLLEGTYQLPDDFKITLGGRYTYDRRNELAFNNAGFQLFGAPASFSGSKNFPAFTPRFVFAWDNGPTNLYYSFTRGFKAGGFVSPSPFPGQPVDAEKITNHEVGVKQTAFDGKLFGSLSVFHYKNDGLQQQIVNASGGGTTTQNAGSAKATGVELEVSARPLSGLALGGSVGYLHAYYSDYQNAAVVCFDPSGTLNPGFPGATLYQCRKDLTGTTLPHAPTWTTSLNGSYTFAIGSWSANVAGLAQYRSSYLFWPGAGGDLQYDRQGGYTVANFSGYVSPPGGKLRLGFYVDNAFNKQYASIRTTSQPWGVDYDAAKPIAYGARVEYKF
jgi:iron complex outermembrane receptor protein